MNFNRIAMAGMLWLAAALSTPAVSAAPPAAPSNAEVDYRAIFDAYNAGFEKPADPDSNLSDPDNSRGRFAWSESYIMQAYMQMYRATGDQEYLRKLTRRFDTILPVRDDRLGRLDEYTSTSLAGWGSASYDKGAKWHVFIVHTAMITLGPADFVHAVLHDATLQPEFGTSATLYRAAIEECIRDTEPYYRDGPDEGEGHYVDPGIGMLPFNQFNALGNVLLVMQEVTSSPLYLDRAEKLARFYRNRITTVDNRFRWAYWPLPRKGITGEEDISHAAINVEFALRCARRNIVFTPADMEYFARTWLHGVRRPDGTWAATVDGARSPENPKSLTSAAGRWLILCELLPEPLRTELRDDIARAMATKPPEFASQAFGIAHLHRYR